MQTKRKEALRKVRFEFNTPLLIFLHAKILIDHAFIIKRL
jgi:hypothetical protein